MIEIAVSVITFTVVVLVLTLMVLGAKRLLVPSGQCQIDVNGRVSVTANVGQRLLEILAGQGISLPSACGGAGTCGLCKMRILEGGDDVGPQELSHMTRAEALRGVRLACQVSVLHDLKVEVEESSFGVESWTATVQSVRNVSTLIREIVLRLPAGQTMDFRAGGFVQITAPAFQVKFREFEVADIYRDVWDQADLWSYEVTNDEPVTRAYSMANHPSEAGLIILNVRIALPPPGERSVPPGIVSSWLFSLKSGDTVQLTGPFGHFFVEDGDNEIMFIGGGAGMAPLRAQILDLLETHQSKRTITFWYGARSRRELFYQDTFDRLQTDHENFRWHVALSDPQADDEWEGYTGFIHRIVAEQYLGEHPAPESCDYYLCGPPLMVKAVRAMLDDLGVEPARIHFDDFGG